MDPKKAKSLAEYFTGKKEIPNYDEMTKAAKNLLAAGINFEMFEDILGHNLVPTWIVIRFCL